MPILFRTIYDNAKNEDARRGDAINNQRRKRALEDQDKGTA